jgi:hypothetical protein
LQVISQPRLAMRINSAHGASIRAWPSSERKTFAQSQHTPEYTKFW